MNSIASYGNLKLFNYDSKSNTLYINFPKDLKIHINNDINLIINNECNITCGEFNLLTLFKNIHLDSYDACIHLNSRKAKQLDNLNNLIQIKTTTVKSFSELLNLRLIYLNQLRSLLCKII